MNKNVMAANANANILPKKRDWWSYFSLWFVQSFNTFNDKVAQFLVISLGVYVLGQKSLLAKDLAALLVLPFIIFAPLSGWLNDKLSKVLMLRLMQALQLICLGAMIFALRQRELVWVQISFGALATQSAFLNPAKKGLIYETLGPARVGFGTGILELGTMFFAIIGMVAATVSFDNLKGSLGGWATSENVIWVLLANAVLCLIVSFIIKPKWKVESKMSEKVSPLDYLSPIKAAFTTKKMGYAALISVFFQITVMWVPLTNEQFIREFYFENYDSEITKLYAALGAGVLLGALVGAVTSYRKVDLSMIPLVMLVLLGIGVAGVYFHHILPVAMVLLALMSAFGVYTLIMGNAYLIKNAPEQRRGRAIAGVSMLGSGGAFIAAMIHKFLEQAGMSVTAEYWLLTGLCFVFAVIAWRGFGRNFMRALIVNSSRLNWRIRTLGQENVPLEDGFLVVSNHVTWGDSGIVNAAIPRDVRFLMDVTYSKVPIIGSFTSWFNTILISPTRAKDALVKGAEAIKEGSAVCIFPEGRLTRSGQLNEIKRGFHLMAKKADSKILPLYMNGLWGSVLSFERGRYFTKLPYLFSGQSVTAACGELMATEEATPEKLRLVLEKLSYDCLEDAANREPERLRKATTKIGEKYDSNLSARAILANARQLQNVNFHSECKKLQFVVLRSAKQTLPVLEAYALLKKNVSSVDYFESSESFDGFTPAKQAQLVVVGTRSDREVLEGMVASKKITWLEIHETSEVAKPSSPEKGIVPVNYCPCLVNQGIFISAALAFEPDTNSSLGAELGHKDGGFGRLLPGFYRRKEVLVGFDIERVQFDGFELDDDGFVFLGELIREPNPSREIDHDFASTDAFDAEVIELKDR